MRPKPLMATLTLASVVVFTAAACKSECKGGGQRSASTGASGAAKKSVRVDGNSRAMSLLRWQVFSP